MKKSKLSDNMSERLVQLYDPVVFLEHCVFTQDEVDRFAPVKPAPVERPYIPFIARCWEMYDNILVDKSRRMWVSWLFLSLNLHLAMTRTNARVGIVSEKFEKSCEHLVNMEFIYKNIPEDVWPSSLRPKLRTKQGFLYFDDLNNTIHGLAQGPDQTRQFGFSSLFFDEMCFWPDAEGSMASAQPTLLGGGKLAIVSTHAPLTSADHPYYRKILEDQTGDAGEYREKEALRVQPFERFLPKDQIGLKAYQNRKNRFFIVELDFTADPQKRSNEWIAKAKAGMDPKRWAIEMMRSWETFEGTPIYKGAWYKNIHVAPGAIHIDPNQPILRGWDFGGNQSCAIMQLVDGQLRLIDELPNGGKNTREFAPLVIDFCNQRYGDDQFYIDIIDPSAMWEGKTAAGFSCADVMKDFGLRPKPARTNDPQQRIDAVIYYMMRPIADKRGFLAAPHCKMFIDGCEGGYHFPDKQTQSARMDRPVKNLFSHIHDAAQYVAIYCRGLERRRTQHSGRSYGSNLGYSFYDE